MGKEFYTPSFPGLVGTVFMNWNSQFPDRGARRNNFLDTLIGIVVLIY